MFPSVITKFEKISAFFYEFSTETIGAKSGFMHIGKTVCKNHSTPGYRFHLLLPAYETFNVKQFQDRNTSGIPAEDNKLI